MEGNMQNVGARLVEMENKLVEVTSLFQSLVGELKAASEDVERARKAVRDEREQLGAHRHDPSDDSILLNVGGRRFTTTKETLCAFPHSMLAVWFGGRHTIQKNSHGEIFIDRNPHLFEHVLEYCRNGGRATFLPREERIVAQLRQEFDFFCLPWPETHPPTVFDICRTCVFEGISVRAADAARSRILGMDYSDGLLLTAEASGAVRLWEVPSGGLKHVFDSGRANTTPQFGPGTSAVVTHSFSCVLRVPVGSSTGTMSVWDNRTGGHVGALTGQAEPDTWGLAGGRMIFAQNEEGGESNRVLVARNMNVAPGDAPAWARVLQCPAGTVRGDVKVWAREKHVIVEAGSVFVFRADDGKLLGEVGKPHGWQAPVFWVTETEFRALYWTYETDSNAMGSKKLCCGAWALTGGGNILPPSSPFPWWANMGRNFTWYGFMDEHTVYVARQEGGFFLFEWGCARQERKDVMEIPVGVSLRGVDMVLVRGDAVVTRAIDGTIKVWRLAVVWEE